MFQRFNEVGTDGLWRDYVVNGTNPLRAVHSVSVIELTGYFAYLF